MKTPELELLQNYVHQLQSPSGWSELLALFCWQSSQQLEHDAYLNLLQQIGAQFAQLFALPHTETLGALNQQINVRLQQFNWGIAHLYLQDNQLQIHHLAMPMNIFETLEHSWSESFCLIMQSIYQQWLNEQGGPANLTLSLIDRPSGSEAIYSYQG